MARGAIKTSKKPVEKPKMPEVSNFQNVADDADVFPWINCECIFSLILIILLALLPFNLGNEDLSLKRERFVTKAEEFYRNGYFDKV
jgi:hypothetical protein